MPTQNENLGADPLCCPMFLNALCVIKQREEYPNNMF